MTIAYNNVRCNEGCAIGTIVAFAGSVGDIPKGWLLCNGRTYSEDSYADLFEVIGNEYDYGASTPGVFKVPNLNGAVMDINQNMANNLPSGNIPSEYRNLINDTNDKPNVVVGTSSNFDLRVEIVPDPVNTKFSGTFTGQTLNDPSYSDSVTFVGRVLGDHHLASHNHSGSYKSIIQKGTNSRAGICNAYGNDPANSSPVRNCDPKSYHAIEANGNARFFASSFVKLSSRGNSGWGVNLQAGNTNNYATGQIDTFNNPVRNFIPSTDDALESDQTRNTGVEKGTTSTAAPNDPGSTGSGTFGYPTTLNFPITNFVGSAIAHFHDAIPFSINRGSMSAPNVVNTNNITIGDITPVNDTIKDIATIAFPSLDTPSLSLIYIIRAY